MPPRGKHLTASEIGQYGYCARAWWLGTVEGNQPTNVEAIVSGVRAHERHGWQVSLARLLARGALVLFAGAVLVLSVWALRLAL
jgi:hypothetical protein